MRQSFLPLTVTYTEVTYMETSYLMAYMEMTYAETGYMAKSVEVVRYITL
jgi:hypothetical protein